MRVGWPGKQGFVAAPGPLKVDISVLYILCSIEGLQSLTHKVIKTHNPTLIAWIAQIECQIMSIPPG